ncbi:MAG TPA: SLBB domain-containing protein [Gemmatimonadales bacterium]|nr:SLBB domain-containing protein [Gemmatimonadales bacterium]
MIQRMVGRLVALLLLAAPLAAQQSAKRVPQSDFDVGDQILLEVEGDTVFSRSYSVAAGPSLPLPVVGAIPLAGVRRADIETYLTQQLGRYLKNPVVHARVLVRLGVLGEVEHPGFYPVPSTAVVSDALMSAGGPTKDAKFGGARIERDGKGLYEGRAFQDAMSRGMTIDGMGLHTGDRIVVPRRHDAESTVRIIGILVGLPVAILGIRQLVH